MVSESSVSVISQGKVLWESKIKEFLDGEISATPVVLRVFSMEMLVCSLSEDTIEVANTDCVETGVFTKYVVDSWSTEVINLLTKVLGGHGLTTSRGPCGSRSHSDISTTTKSIGKTKMRFRWCCY